jgi:hypothetical protein
VFPHTTTTTLIAQNTASRFIDFWTSKNSNQLGGRSDFPTFNYAITTRRMDFSLYQS